MSRGRMESCNPTSVLWNPASDDDPGFAAWAKPASHARAGAPPHEGRRPGVEAPGPPDDAFLTAILAEHGFDEVPA